MDRALLDRIDATARGLEAVLVWIGRKRSRLFLPVPLLMVALAEPSVSAMPIGLMLVLAGSLFRLWSAGYLEKNQRLITAGPYAYVRHPLYLGMLLVLAGWCTLVGWIPWGAVMGSYALLLYGSAIVMEERRLQFLFPEHAEYRQEVGTLLPLRRYANPFGRFCWQNVWRNKEPQTLGWNLLITALLVMRAWV